MKATVSPNKAMKHAVTAMLLFLLAAAPVLAGDLNPQAGGENSLTQVEIKDANELSVYSNTLFSFFIPQGENVNLTIFNTAGKEVAVLINEDKVAGEFSADLTKHNLKKGNYFYRLVVGKYKEVRKLEIIK